MERALQTIFRKGFDDYASGRKLPLHYHKTAYWIKHCRSARLGGHTFYCPNGHVDRIQYNSCHSRSCPQCNGLIQARWLQKQQEQLLTCSHRHLIFTIDHALNPLFKCNRREMTHLLFRSLEQTIRSFTGDDRYLGGTVGLLLALHTWSRALSFHPHIHCLLSEGGLDDQGEWRSPKKSHYLPIKAVMIKFRGKLLSMIRTGINNGSLQRPKHLTDTTLMKELRQSHKKKWNVRIEQRYAHGKGIATYLARYMRKGPVSNQQLQIDNHQNQLTFHYRRAGALKERYTLKVSIESFIQKVLQHIPEPGSPTIRRYGLYAPNKRRRLNIARTHCGQLSIRDVTKTIDWKTYCTDYLQRPVRENCEKCGERLASKAIARYVLPIVRSPPLEAKEKSMKLE